MDNALEKPHNRFGLLGRDISYSFSQGYFTKKFKALNLKDHAYQNFDLKNIQEFPLALKQYSNIKGLNVTIPYKQEIIPFLDELDELSSAIGAVNTIKFKGDKLIGYNTDHFGFMESIRPLLKAHHTKALILGTGGASKAVNHALASLGIETKFISRNPSPGQLSYEQLCNSVMASYTIIVNCSPLGTFPDIEACPNIPYHLLSERHLLYDLIYNPEETRFLSLGKKAGAQIRNGHRMLELQAEKSWEIWNS